MKFLKPFIMSLAFTCSLNQALMAAENTPVVANITCDVINHPSISAIKYYDAYGELHFIDKSGAELMDHYDALTVFKATDRSNRLAILNEDDEVVLTLTRKEGILYSTVVDLASGPDNLYIRLENCTVNF